MTVYDLKDCVIVPGFADVHVHLREPGREDEETVQTGMEAGMNGGFTALCCMPNTEPAIDCAEVVTFVKDRAANSLVDVYPIGAVTKKKRRQRISFTGEML